MMRALKVPSNVVLKCVLKKTSSISTLTDGTMKKTLSISAINAKRFIINDHYEFDQKVREKKTKHSFV